MITYQDFVLAGSSGKDRADFIKKVINYHKNSTLYRTAVIANEYSKGQNTTITQYQKVLTDIRGRKYIDQISPNHKSTSNFFRIFVTQFNQYLLGNGVNWQNNNTIEKLGKDFDIKLQTAGEYALCGAVTFCFFNFDHLEVFPVTEFAPLFDEENSELSAGVRFWQLESSKPLRATLYEIDGYTDYMWAKSNYTPLQGDWVKIDSDCYMRVKKPYKLKLKSSKVDGIEVYGSENYKQFPIVPLWGNQNKQSELIGLREKIDAYDLILNGFENDLDNAQIYWIVRGAGGMDDIDLTRFLDRLRTVKAVAPEDGQEVQPVELSIPFEARERLLDRLERQLYRDAMIFNPYDIVNGASTATQIRAAYEPQNVKADQYEYCVLDFLNKILEIAGVDDMPTFTRSQIINTQEEIQTIISAANFLSEEYVTQKILTILGDGDKTKDVLTQMSADNMDSLNVDNGNG